MTSYVLAVADTLIVPISFRTADGASARSFAFTLTMDRQSEEEWNAGVADSDGVVQSGKIKDHLISITKGWKDQRFVLDDDRQPADFCAEALNVMLSAVGVGEVVLRAYMKENSAKVKNS